MNKTALIIDDEPDYCSLLSAILEQDGWRVFQAEEGEGGIESARSHQPDVVICDLLMPRCNGFQVCRTLRKEPGLRNTKIIVSSGRDFDNDRQAAFQAGADIYLTKPFEPMQLINILSRLFTESRHGHGNGNQRNNGNSPEGMTLKFWGVRGSIPTPGPSTVEYGGNTSCIELRCEGQIVILDAGTGLRSLGKSLMKEFDQQPPDLTLLLTHTHWDHIQGLPFFLPFYRPNNHLRILGYEGARNGLETVLSSQMESTFFPVGLKQVPANLVIEELKELNFPVGRLQVRAFFANHPGICVGYRIFGAGVSVAFFPDNEPYLGQIKAGHLNTAKDPAALEYARTQDHKMIEFLRGTDVLIMDSQYDCDEYKDHLGWGHGCLDEVVDVAIRSEVKQLFLFHHDPDHDDTTVSGMAAKARQLAAERGSALQVAAAKEGMMLEVPALAAHT